MDGGTVHDVRPRVVPALVLVPLAAALVLPPAAASAKPVSKANLKALTNSVNRAKHLTYAATYTAVAGGQTSTVTIAQERPTSSSFKLNQYSSKPSASLFSLPAGATTQSVP